MTERFDIHGHDVVFNKNEGKAVIAIQLGETEEECILIDIFSVDDKEYIALLSGESSEIYLFRYTDIYGEDNIDLTMIDDEDEIDEVFHIFSHYWTDEKIDELIDEYDAEANTEEE